MDIIDDVRYVLYNIHAIPTCHDQQCSVSLCEDGGAAGGLVFKELGIGYK